MFPNYQVPLVGKAVYGMCMTKAGNYVYFFSILLYISMLHWKFPEYFLFIKEILSLLIISLKTCLCCGFWAHVLMQGYKAYWSIISLCFLLQFFSIVASLLIHLHDVQNPQGRNSLLHLDLIGICGNPGRFHNIDRMALWKMKGKTNHNSLQFVTCPVKSCKSPMHNPMEILLFLFHLWNFCFNKINVNYFYCRKKSGNFHPLHFPFCIWCTVCH